MGLKHATGLVAMISLVAGCGAARPVPSAPEESAVPKTFSDAFVPDRPAPVAPRIAHSFEYHGVRVSAPYHWLKDQGYPTVDDPEVLAYLNAENAYYGEAMATLEDLSEVLFQEMRARRPEAEQSVPWREGAYWYQWRFEEGAQYRSWLWAPSDPATGEPSADAYRVLLDEAKLAEGHEFFRLGGLELSPDHRLLAYSDDTTGGERYRLHLVDSNTGEPRHPPIEQTIGSPVFSADGRYLFYRVVNSEWRPHRVMRLDLSSGAQEVVFEESDASYFVGLDSTQSDAFIVISSGDHITSELYLLARSEPLAELQLISPRRPGHEYDLEHRGDRLIIRSNRDHQNFALYEAPLAQPTEDHWQALVPGSDARYLTGFAVFAMHTVLEERVGGLDQIRVWPGGATAPYAIDFPEASYAAGIGTNAEFELEQLRIGYESMVTPGTVFDFDLAERTLRTRKVREIPSGYTADDYRTERLNVQVRDGELVPVSLVYHRDMPPAPDRPLYLYGYGAYGSAISPGFNPTRLSLLDRGVSFAIAHIRGGDDLGYAWYQAGKLKQRTNTFNDFVDVGADLMERGYSGKGKIAMVGGSAGGELVGAAVNQAREWLGAAVLHVPFVDVLNTMLDTSLPLTPMEWPEWGNPIEDAEAFRLIQSYSPYDQLQPGAYPPMLVTGGLNDPRVTYWEPAKYVAKLRTLKTNDAALLLKINMGAGHGGKSGRFDALREDAQEYAFLLRALGIVREPS